MRDCDRTGGEISIEGGAGSCSCRVGVVGLETVSAACRPAASAQVGSWPRGEEVWRSRRLVRGFEHRGPRRRCDRHGGCAVGPGAVSPVSLARSVLLATSRSLHGIWYWMIRWSPAIHREEREVGVACGVGERAGCFTLLRMKERGKTAKEPKRAGFPCCPQKNKNKKKLHRSFIYRQQLETEAVARHVPGASLSVLPVRRRAARGA